MTRQLVFPSKTRSVLHRISVRTKHTLRLADLEAIEALGISRETYASLTYARSQEIGDAAAFLAFDGILAPSARWSSQNLVIFSDRFEPADLTIVESEPVDWYEWRKTRTELLRR